MGRLLSVVCLGSVVAAALLAAAGGPAPSLVPTGRASQRAFDEIPPAMLAHYRQASGWAGGELGCPLSWAILAAIGAVETGHGARRDGAGNWVALDRGAMTSSAGAVGPMQFLPATWAQYGVDATTSRDGIADVWDPADAAFGAANLLCASGARDGNLAAALYAYNHSDAYVRRVEALADEYGKGTATSFVCPVAGSVQFAASFGAPRAGPPPHPHQGNDMMAVEGTPTVATEGGQVVRATGTDTGLGGITVWVQGDSGAAYYYAHHRANAVDVGQRVEAGAVVGYVGRTGNAASTPPHLHFEIHPDGRASPAVDPYPTLTAACRPGGP